MGSVKGVKEPTKKKKKKKKKNIHILAKGHVGSSGGWV